MSEQNNPSVRQPTVWPPNTQEACSGEGTLVPASLRGYREWRLDPSSPIGLAAINEVFGVWSAADVDAVCKKTTAGQSFQIAMRRAARAFGAPAQVNATAVVDPTPEHPAPQSDCGCGIYAWYRPDLVDGTARVHNGGRICSCGCGAINPLWAANTTTYQPQADRVIGAIDASGRVLLGTRGFRAERAKIAAVVVPPRHQLLFHVLPQLGVAAFETLDQLLEQFPPADDLDALGVDVEQVSPPAPPPGPEAEGTITIDLGYQAQMLRLMQQVSSRSSRSFDQLQQEVKARQREVKARQREMEQVARGCRRPPSVFFGEPSPAERALEARRQRNTGPAAAPRPPRSIFPRRAR